MASSIIAYQDANQTGTLNYGAAHALAEHLVAEDDELIARLKGERGTALQAAQCYRAQRDLAWAEIDRLKEQLK
jgi:hypothetical protein